MSNAGLELFACRRGTMKGREVMHEDSRDAVLAVRLGTQSRG